MAFGVFYANEVVEVLRGVEVAERRTICAALAALSGQPRPEGRVRLRAQGAYRIAVGRRPRLLANLDRLLPGPRFAIRAIAMVRAAKVGVMTAVTAALPRIDLIARDRALYDVWTQLFEPFEDVAVHLGDYFAKDADAMLSPANSFGIMDGGLDLAIRDQLGFEVQARAQKTILEEHHGELPVGAAVVVPTDHPRWPYLIVAPTMRVPEPVPRSLNAYLAFRAALTAVVRFNEMSAGPGIRSLVCPGLATGIGQMPPRRCAAQMRLAYVQISRPARIPSFEEIHRLHEALSTAD